MKIVSPNVEYESMYDEVYFNKDVVEWTKEEKVGKIMPLVQEIVALIDGMNKNDLREIGEDFNRIRFLMQCPNCGSRIRKGFRCAYCGALMIKYE